MFIFADARPMRIFFFLAFVGIVINSAGATAEWDDHCTEGGQCSNIIKNYETLITGEGCRTFYFTGKCSRICTYSLKSLMGRQMWSKCADRCEWSKAVTRGAASWLDMCLAHPADDVFHLEEAVTNTSKSFVLDGDQNSSISGRTAYQSISSGSLLGTISYYVFFAVVLIGAIVIMSTPPWRTRFQNAIRNLGVRMRKLRGKKSYGHTSPGKGPLDLGLDRQEIRNMQRGARRHLKAMRATLD